MLLLSYIIINSRLDFLLSLIVVRHYIFKIMCQINFDVLIVTSSGESTTFTKLLQFLNVSTEYHIILKNGCSKSGRSTKLPF